MHSKRAIWDLIFTEPIILVSTTCSFIIIEFMFSSWHRGQIQPGSFPFIDFSNAIRAKKKKEELYEERGSSWGSWVALSKLWGTKRVIRVDWPQKSPWGRSGLRRAFIINFMWRGRHSTVKWLRLWLNNKAVIGSYRGAMANHMLSKQATGETVQ